MKYVNKKTLNTIMIRTVSNWIQEHKDESQKNDDDANSIDKILQEVEYQVTRHADKISKISKTEINLESKGFCMPMPPDGLKTKTNKERAREAFEWNLRVKQRKEATILAHKKKLPVAAIMNIVDFI